MHCLHFQQRSLYLTKHLSPYPPGFSFLISEPFRMVNMSIHHPLHSSMKTILVMLIVGQRQSIVWSTQQIL